TSLPLFFFQGLVTLNFMQEKKEADFRYGLVRVRENAESIAFYGGEGNEMQLLLQRFRRAFENLTVMGPSGSGKTSFLRALAGLWNTGKGNVIFYVKDAGKHAQSVSADNDSSKSEDVLKMEEEQSICHTSTQGLQFRPVLLGTGGTYRYVDRSLPGGSIKNRSSAVDFGCWRPIEEEIDRRRSIKREIDRRQSIEEEKGKKKRKRIKKKKRGRKNTSLARRPRPPAVVARGRFFSHAKRWSVSPRGEKDRGDIAATHVQAHLYRQIEAAGITYISIGHRTTLRKYHKNILCISKYDARGSERNWHFEPISQTATEANSTC
ncbi:hypothetical protein BHM03_00010443, partial [Ensete ventricosum]